jgi:hypothetical protein
MKMKSARWMLRVGIPWCSGVADHVVKFVRKYAHRLNVQGVTVAVTPRDERGGLPL